MEVRGLYVGARGTLGFVCDTKLTTAGTMGRTSCTDSIDGLKMHPRMSRSG